MNQLRQRADPAADALVRQLFEHAGPGRADFGRLGYNHILQLTDAMLGAMRSVTDGSPIGTVVNTHTISREAALIAHTRSNAYLFFRENDLGQIQSGYFADLAVIDKDYLTVPADQIKDIKPVITMVGGKVAYDANAAGQRATR